MKIVASTKLNRAQRAMVESRTYGKTSNTVFDNAETRALDVEGKKTLLIVASSDKGLCGSIHSGLSKTVRKKLVENPDAEIVCIGEKSKAQLGRSSGKNIVLSFANVGKDVPTFAEAQAIADQITQLPGKYENIEIIYNSFISAVSYEPKSIEAFSEEAIANSRKLSRYK
jgi:F-type H+-transporting ATPase subunit gamma